MEHRLVEGDIGGYEGIDVFDFGCRGHLPEMVLEDGDVLVGVPLRRKLRGADLDDPPCFDESLRQRPGQRRSPLHRGARKRVESGPLIGGVDVGPPPAVDTYDVLGP
jgi:hypothetical protein